MKKIALLCLAVAACSTTPTAPKSVTTPRVASATVNHTTPPPAPTDLSVLNVIKDGRFYFATIQWTDNATEEFITRCHLSGSNLQSVAAYSGVDYPEGTGVRTFTFKIPRGAYSIYCEAVNQHELGFGVVSAPSNTVTFSTS